LEQQLVASGEATEKIRSQWLDLESRFHAAEGGLLDANDRNEASIVRLVKQLGDAVERADDNSADRGVKLTMSFRTEDELQRQLNTARAERDAARQELERQAAAAAEAAKVIGEAAAHRDFQTRWDRVMKKHPFLMEHVHFLMFRESGHTGFPAELWPLYRFIRLQGKALTYDFQHLFGTPELSTIADKKKEHWGVESELMDGSVESITKILELYDVHLRRAGKELINSNARTLALSFDGVICDGGTLIGNDGRAHGVMPGKVQDLTKGEMDAIRGDPAKCGITWGAFRRPQSARSTSLRSHHLLRIRLCVPIAAAPALTSAINDEHMKEFFDRIVTNLELAIAGIAARSPGAAFDVKVIGLVSTVHTQGR
jgi:hypothetical protein